MAMINKSVKSLRLAACSIPTIPSSPTFLDALQAAQKSLGQFCFRIRLLSFFAKCKNTKSLKVNGKIGEK